MISTLCTIPLYWFPVDGVRGQSLTICSCIVRLSLGSAFNPAIVYGLWYVTGATTSFYALVPHVVGPLLGAALAGIVIGSYFPD